MVNVQRHRNLTKAINTPQSAAENKDKNNMALDAHDINGSPFSVGDAVNLRGIVTAITNVVSGVDSIQDSVTVSVDTPGNVGDKVASVIVSPKQCRRAQRNLLQ